MTSIHPSNVATWNRARYALPTWSKLIWSESILIIVADQRVIARSVGYVVPMLLEFSARLNQAIAWQIRPTSPPITAYQNDVVETG